MLVDQADGIRVLSAVETTLPLPVSESVKVGLPSAGIVSSITDAHRPFAF